MTPLACRPRTGSVTVPSSKSQLHRLLILAALGQKTVTVYYRGYSADVAATVQCLRALGAKTECFSDRMEITPLSLLPVNGRASGEESPEKLLPCGESGSTLRFLLPVTGALGYSAAFSMEKGLPDRPLLPLTQQLCQHGMRISRQGSTLFCSGQLQPGRFCLPGDISSQFVSGLLLAAAVMEAETGKTSQILLTGPLQSAGYVQMTVSALKLAGITVHKQGNAYTVQAGRLQLPAVVTAQGDDSAAAYFLCMGAFSRVGVTVRGLDAASEQADRAAVCVLQQMGAAVQRQDGAVTIAAPPDGRLCPVSVACGNIPDLVPTLAAVAFFAGGVSEFTHVERLRWKESDRLNGIMALAAALGVKTALLSCDTVEKNGSRLLVYGIGGKTDRIKPAQPEKPVRIPTFADHRLAMAAAVAACGADRLGFTALQPDHADCVQKSYPDFWRDFAQLQPEI